MGFPAGGAIALPIGPQFNKPGGGLFAQPPAPTGTGMAPSSFDDFGLEAGTYGNVGLAETGAPLVFGPKMGGGDEYRLLNPSGQSVTATFGSLQDAFNFMSNTPIDPTTGDYAPQAAPAPAPATPAPMLSFGVSTDNPLHIRQREHDAAVAARGAGLPRQLPQTMPQPLAAPSGFNVNQAAAGALQQAMGSTAGAITDPLRVSQYMNPYTQAVIERTQQDIERQRQMAANQLGAQASAAGAFGGSRQGVAEGVLAGEYGRMGADIAAQQRQAGYSQAMQQAMADRAARLGAAQQLAGLGRQAFTTGQTIQQQQAQQGLLQQALQQRLIDAARGQYQGYVGEPERAMQLPLQALGQTPYPSTTRNATQPGLFSYLQFAAGLPGMF